MLNFKWTSARVGVPLAQVRESAITSSRHVLQQWEIKKGKSEVSSITFIGWALFSTCGNLVVTRASNPLVASLPTILDLVLRWMNIIILPQSRISSSSAEILYSGGFSSSTISEFFHSYGILPQLRNSSTIADFLLFSAVYLKSDWSSGQSSEIRIPLSWVVFRVWWIILNSSCVSPTSHMVMFLCEATRFYLAILFQKTMFSATPPGNLTSSRCPVWDLCSSWWRVSRVSW